MGTWNGKSDGEEESGTVTAHAVVCGRVQRVQKVEETLNEFKRTRLVSRNVGRRREWEGRRVGGQVDCD